MTLPTGSPEEHVSKGTPDEAKAMELAKSFYKAMEKNKRPT